MCTLYIHICIYVYFKVIFSNNNIKYGLHRKWITNIIRNRKHAYYVIQRSYD